MSQELEDRYYRFAAAVRDFCREVKWDSINNEYFRQLIRLSASVGAKYIEASDNLGVADEKMKLRIARREAKESIHWLKLILTYEAQHLEIQRTALLAEAEQIRKILSAIIKKLG